MANTQDRQAGRWDSMSVGTFLLEVSRKQVRDGGRSHLSTQRVLSALPGPSLRADQKNRIIIYCGAFNPPHAGHVACLVDGMQHVAKHPDEGDLVACIVVPLDDEFLLKKEQKSIANGPPAFKDMTPMTLSGKDRADLLSSYIHSAASGLDEQLRSTVHIWAPSQAKTVIDIPRLLADGAKQKGFDMDFVVLRSCEYLYQGDKEAERYPRVIHPQCSMAIYTNVGGRSKDAIWQADGNLRPLEEPWTKWEALVEEEELGEGVSRTVWSTKSPTSEQRMLDTRNTLKSEPCFSSTQIRRLLYASDFKDREKLEQDLHEAGAILPEELILKLEAWVNQKDTQT